MTIAIGIRDGARTSTPAARITRSWALDLELGDCIAFHMKTVHGAPGTAQHPFRRRAFSTRWLGDDAVFATRPFPTSPPFPELALKPGDPMEHELFPVVFQDPARLRPHDPR
ncbi:MAG TPA: hypothetical protein VJ921_12395 [Vicinamibacteria bacterium]|nr:hypothetical protein [Vicinamibacteria bacterium]